MKFRTIDPSVRPFPESSVLADSILISSYRDVQVRAGNIRYSKKEHAHGLMCAAIKIENHSSHTFTLTPQHFHVYQDTARLHFVTPEEYVKKVKQHRGWYLFYILTGPAAILVTKSSFLDPKGDALSSFLTAGTIAMYYVFFGNAQRATNANHNNLGFQRQYEIFDRLIQPGETAYGFVLVKTHNDNQFRFIYE